MTITAKFTVTELHQGAPGLAHGGLLSCAFDEALGKLMWLVRQPAVTGKLETLFVAPVPVGTTLFINAEIVGQEGRKIYCKAEGRLGSNDGAVAVEAAAIFIVVQIRPFLSPGGGGRHSGPTHPLFSRTHPEKSDPGGGLADPPTHPAIRQFPPFFHGRDRHGCGVRPGWVGHPPPERTASPR